MSNDIIYKKDLYRGIDRVYLELTRHGKYYMLFKTITTDFSVVEHKLLGYQSTAFDSSSIIEMAIVQVNYLKEMGYRDVF